jgi:hypothetical protein
VTTVAAHTDELIALETVVELTGADSIRAITHCQGSTSFMMAACAGLLPEVRTVVASAVSLHPVVPKMAKLKLDYVVPPVSRLLGYLDPQWGEKEAPWLLPKMLTAYCKGSRRDCDNGVCKVSSFMFGAGNPTLWTHEQLSAATHEWTKGEFGPAPLTFFKQIAKCIHIGHLVSVEGRPELPESFVAQAPLSDARVLFMTGGRNNYFLRRARFARTSGLRSASRRATRCTSCPATATSTCLSTSAPRATGIRSSSTSSGGLHEH